MNPKSRLQKDGARELHVMMLMAGLFLAGRANAIVTPSINRAFSTNTCGADIIGHMQIEGLNPSIAGTVVHFVNFSPVDVTGDGAPDFGEWTGTLISPEWVLTCAHALQGTNGRGGGLVTNDIYFNFGGTSFPNPADSVIAEFRLHPAWAKESYTNGYDIALVRLAVPVTNVAVFPKLPAIPFNGQVGVIVAGYGEHGDGDTGGNGNPGPLAVGVNSLDGVGGQWLTNGYGQGSVLYSNWPSSVAFMDFDKWEQRAVACGSVTNSAPLALSDFSTMGIEHAVSAPARESCGAPNPPAIPGTFLSGYCDFLPGGGDSGGPAFAWPNAPDVPPTGFYLSGTPTILGVVSYRSRGNQTNATSVYGNVAAYTLVQPHTGWIYQETGLAGLTPATFIKRPLDVQVVNIRILAEQAVGADETEIEFTSDLENTDTGRYRELSLSVVRANLPPTAVAVDPQLDYPVLAEQGTAIAGIGNTLVVRVANADVANVRQLILSGQALEVTAFEEQVYSGPTKFIDQPTDNAFEGTTGNILGELVLIFTTETDLIRSLQAGDILIADTTLGAYRPKQPPPSAQFAIPYLSQQIPFEISSISTVNGKVHVAGHERELYEILKSGTFVASDENFNGAGRDLLDPPVENSYTAAEKEERAEQALFFADANPTDSRLADLGGLNAIPWRFNEVEITPALRLSGQVLLRSSGLRFQVAFREFALKRASVGIDAGLAASMVLETTGTNNNTGVPLLDKQKELARIPLPHVPITIAGIPCSIGPTFVLSVGAEASAPGGLSIPFETSVTLGTEIGWANGQTFATPIKEFVAPHVSDPTVFDAVAAHAKAWAEARLEVDISVAGGIGRAGPSLAIRAEAGFEVAPFTDPWWSMDVGADLVAAFEMDLLGFNVARVETTEDIATFFHRDAGEPLITAPLLRAASTWAAAPVEIGPKAGDKTRWALAFAAPNASANYAKGFVTPLAGGGHFVGGGAAIPSFLGVVSAEGVPQWMQTFAAGAKPVDAVQLSDGAVMVAGYQGLDWWLAKYDLAGNRLWMQSHRMQADLRDLSLGTAGNGDPEFYLAGYQNPVLVRESDPVVLKLDADGNLIWAKVYTLAKDDEVYSIQTLRDGNLLLTGNTDDRVGTDPILGASWNGLVMKITPAGEVLWATAVPGRWGMSFRDSAEGPDGSLFAVGSHGDIIRDYYPSVLVGKFTPEGELIHHVLLGEDPDWDDQLPDGGDTPYDAATRVAWRDDSLILVGNTGLGGSASAWVASLTDELGVKWFSAFDGPKACTFEDLALTADGIMAMGWIDGPWPSVFTNRTPAWLVSLPWEGLMRFHPHAGVRSSYLQPRVFLSSTQSDFIGQTEDNYDRLIPVRTASVPFVVSNSVPVAGGNVVAGVVTSFATARLERLEPSILTSYDEWAAYHQLTGTNALPVSDVERDGAKNLWEFFAGTDPLNGSTNPPVGLTIQYDAVADTVAIGFGRARAAAGQPYHLQYSVDLKNWMPATGATLQVVDSTELLDWLTLTLPRPHPHHAFFRLELPYTP